MVLSCTLFFVYLVMAHYIKAYSDPVGFLYKARAMWQGNPVTERSFVYPALLGAGLKILGPVYVFLFNCPFVVLLAFLVYRLNLVILVLHHSERGDKEFLRFFAFVGMIIFIVVHHRLLLDLQNPFREPMCFSLLIGSVLAAFWFRGSRGYGSAFGCGCLLGLAASTRETCLLVVPAVLIWACYNCYKERDLTWVRFFDLAAIGGLIGLVPFFLQNCMHSGHAIVPSYAAQKVQTVASSQRWDIPVPGMSLWNFGTTGASSIQFFVENYRWFGLLLMFLGLLRCIRKKDVNALAFLVPAALLNFLFYCFYWYVKHRYLLVVDIFLIPFLGLGLLTLVEWFRFMRGRTMSKEGVVCIRTWGYLVLTVVMSSFLVVSYVRNSPRFRAWHVEGFRNEILPHLEEPFMFVGARHYCTMLAWLLDGDFLEPSRRFAREYEQNAMKDLPLDDYLRKVRSQVITDCKTRNVYSYGEKAKALLGNWYDFVPLLSFKDLASPIEHYGKPMSGTLYRVMPWTHRHVEKSIKMPSSSGGNVLLIVDAGRLKDDPLRTFATLRCGDAAFNLKGDVGFFELQGVDAKAENLLCVLDSDAPLPESPWIKCVARNSELSFGLGATALPRPYSLCSESLLWPFPFKSDSRLLWDAGRISLPAFADVDSDVYARIRLEFVQDDPLFKDRGFTISLSSPEETFSCALPPARHSCTVVVLLARGTGSLEQVPLDLTTNLPDIFEQQHMRHSGKTSAFAFVKLYNATLFSRPRIRVPSFLLDMGSKDDDLYLKAGFYSAEKDEHGSFRWSSGTSVMALPLQRDIGRAVFTLRCLVPQVIQDVAPQPVFAVDGVPVSPERVRCQEEGEGIFCFTFEADLTENAKRSAVRLEISTPTWFPRDMGSADSREMGIRIYSLRASQVDKDD